MAENLAEFYGGKRLSFADPLRRMYAAEHHIEIKELTKVPEKYKYRSELQRYGDQKRAEQPMIFVDALVAEIKRHYNFGTRIFFVDDLRLPEEYATLKELGFIMVGLDWRDKWDEVLTEEQAQHESEQYWRDFEADFELPWQDANELSPAQVKQAVYDRLARLYLLLDRETVKWNSEIATRRGSK